jgi:hypothetical protein
MNIQEIVQKIKTNESVGLSEKYITDFENEINWHFPEDFRNILKAVDGGYGEVGYNYIDFWSINDIGFYVDEMKDLDELILFASDGCGMAFAFDKRSNEIYSIPMDCLERGYEKIIAKNFNDFIQKLTSQKLEY